MSLIANMNPSQLRRRRAGIIAELHHVAPALMQELETVDQQLATLGTPGKPYAHLQIVVEAVKLHLGLHGEWQTKQEISDALVAGGFREGRKMGRYLIRDAINHHVDKGALVESNGKIGLPEWNKPSSPA